MIFEKEDLTTKKQLTRFLLSNQIDFYPDQHSKGQYHALIRIEGVSTDKKPPSTHAKH